MVTAAVDWVSTRSRRLRDPSTLSIYTWFNRGAQINIEHGASRTADTIDNDSDMDPTWNTAAAKVPAFLAALKRHDFLFNRTKGALSLYTRGYITDSKNRKVVLGSLLTVCCRR